MIVMKFGGTSVEDAAAIDRVASIVRGRLADKPVVVVSAMSKITDQLVAMGRAAAAGKLDEALDLARRLRERHHATARQLLTAAGYKELRPRIDSTVDALDQLLRGIVAVGELSDRTSDYLLSFGECLSSVMVAAAFRRRGLNAEHVDSRRCIVTNNNYMRAAPLWTETNQRTRANVEPVLDAGRVPVMGGFIASTREGIPTTLGRGGSDFSAAIIGAALGASRIEIWTDVEGMMTTDPRLCPNAQSITIISFDEAAEMAFFGAKVLHPATLVPAVQKNIPVYVLNSRNPESKGTCVRKKAPPSRTMFRAIAFKKNVTIVAVSAARMMQVHGFMKALFDVFDRHSCAVDIVSTSEVSVSLAVDSNQDIGALLADLRKLADVSVENKKAIICMVGSDIHGRVGVAAKVFTTVAAAGVNVRMISQGASEINISFVINEDDVPAAVRTLHAEFFEKPAALGHGPAQQIRSTAKRAAKAATAAE